MGDIHSRLEGDPAMARVLAPPPGVLARTLGGVGLTVDRDYTASRTAEDAAGFLERTDAILRHLVCQRPDLPRCVNPDDAEAVVFQRIRWHRRSMLRIAIRSAVSREAPSALPLLRSQLDAFNHLAGRTRRYRLEPKLLDDIEALALWVATSEPTTARTLLAELIAHLRDDVLTYRSRVFSRDWASAAEARHHRRRPPAVVQRSWSPPPHHGTVIALHSTPELSPHGPRRSPPPPATTTAPSPPPAAKFRTPINAPTTVRQNAGGGEAEEEEAAQHCAVCMDRTRGPRLPCGHKSMCGTCTASVARCPMCRNNFDPSEVAWADASPLGFYVPQPMGEKDDHRTAS
jgi:hypothetical protein